MKRFKRTGNNEQGLVRYAHVGIIYFNSINYYGTKIQLVFISQYCIVKYIFLQSVFLDISGIFYAKMNITVQLRFEVGKTTL
jgi:hypothetical protein